MRHVKKLYRRGNGKSIDQPGRQTRPETQGSFVRLWQRETWMLLTSDCDWSFISIHFLASRQKFDLATVCAETHFDQQRMAVRNHTPSDLGRRLAGCLACVSWSKAAARWKSSYRTLRIAKLYKRYWVKIIFSRSLLRCRTITRLDPLPGLRSSTQTTVWDRRRTAVFKSRNASWSRMRLAAGREPGFWFSRNLREWLGPCRFLQQLDDPGPWNVWYWPLEDPRADSTSYSCLEIESQCSRVWAAGRTPWATLIPASLDAAGRALSRPGPGE